MPLFETVTDLRAGEETLRRRRYGAIDVQGGQLAGVHLRPYAKIISLPEALWLGKWNHRRLVGDRCWLYYNQPLGHSRFLAVKYVVSARECRFASLKAAMTVLEEIARIKRSDAALCDVTNRRISDRLLAREGWERHCLASPRRHHIKRFYGEYAAPDAAWNLCVS
jgi:hypothetical protein